MLHLSLLETHAPPGWSGASITLLFALLSRFGLSIAVILAWRRRLFEHAPGPLKVGLSHV
jgi:hypothetical protein